MGLLYPYVGFQSFPKPWVQYALFTSLPATRSRCMYISVSKDQNLDGPMHLKYVASRHASGHFHYLA